ncbi:MAG TPA: lamin tail domain-containing protein, partial [Chloroflexota bacterium]
MERAKSAQRLVATLAILGPLVAALAGLAGGPAQAAPSPDVVVSQVYGGGANSGAPYNADFVELFNRGTTTVDLTGWSIQYASASGSGTFGASASQITELSGSIQPGGYFLIQEAAGASGAALPSPDLTDATAINMSATGGKVALVNTTTPLGCNGGPTSPCSGAAQASIVDLVGYGSANYYEGAGPAPAASNTTAVVRAGGGCVDSDNNSLDFAASAPSPRNSGSAPNPCADASATATVTAAPTDTPPIGSTPTFVHDIQGAGHVSPLRGQAVANVPGIVTARRPNGFYLQDPNPDGDDRTSEGIFVFTGAAPAVVVGDAVIVGGTVQEFRPGGATSTNLTTTEIATTNTNVVVQSSGNPLPAPVVIGSGGRMPPTEVIEDDVGGDVETSGVFDPASDGIDFYESLEGMLVQVNNPVVVGPRNRFGELVVLADDGANAGVRTARGGIVARPADFNPER